jgi:hypothetical protein
MHLDTLASTCHAVNVPELSARKGVTGVRTTVHLPEELWTAAKIRAVHEKTNLQDVIAAALREYLKRSKKGGKKDEG